MIRGVFEVFGDFGGPKKGVAIYAHPLIRVMVLFWLLIFTVTLEGVMGISAPPKYILYAITHAPLLQKHPAFQQNHWPKHP